MTRRIKLKPAGPPSSLPMIGVAVLTLIVALALVLGVRAIQMAGGGAAGGSLIRVPNDYLTIQEAIDAAKPGDIIQVTAGIYQENITLDKPVSLIAATFDEIDPVRNSTIIDGAGTGATIFIPSGLSQMPVIRGFVLQNGVDNIQASSEFIAEFNYFHSAANLVSYQMGGGGVNRGNVYFNARDNAIRLDHIDRPLLIENNRILYSANSGIEISLQSTSAPPALIEVNMWNNMILGNGEDGIQFVDHPGAPQDTNRRFVIAGNLFANNKQAGIGLMPNANTVEDLSGAATLEAIRVINNTFYGNNYGISGGDNLVAINNIIANSTGRGAWRVPAEEGGISMIAYTLFHNNGADADETSLGPGVILGVDPRFVAAPDPGPDGTWATVDDDFTGLVLRSDSPAIDKGVVQFQAANGELVPPSPLTGFLGAAPDLGWREFGAPVFMTPTTTPVGTATHSPTVTPATLTATPGTTATLAPSTPGTSTATALTPTQLATTTSIPGTPTSAGSPTVTIATTASPEVTLQNIAPNSAQAETTLSVVITGSGFQTGAMVTFEGGGGLPQEIKDVQVLNPTTIMFTLTAHNDGTSAQVWDVRVTNPDTSTAVLVDAFTVNPAP